MIFMRFKKWVIFIKELRDWYINKWYSKDNYLIENHDIEKDIIIVIINLDQCLYDDFVRILLTFWVLV